MVCSELKHFPVIFPARPFTCGILALIMHHVFFVSLTLLGYARVLEIAWDGWLKQHLNIMNKLFIVRLIVMFYMYIQV